MANLNELLAVHDPAGRYAVNVDRVGARSAALNRMAQGHANTAVRVAASRARDHLLRTGDINKRSIAVPTGERRRVTLAP